MGGKRCLELSEDKRRRWIRGFGKGMLHAYAFKVKGENITSDNVETRGCWFAYPHARDIRRDDVCTMVERALSTYNDM